MRQLLFFFLVMLSASYGVALGVEDLDKHLDPPKDLEQMLVNKKLMVAKLTWPNGKVKEVCTFFRRPGTETDVPYMNDIPSEVDVFHGVRQLYDQLGSLSEIQTYYAGKKHGTQFEFKDGVIISERQYRYGVMDGMYREYYESGLIKFEETFVNGNSVATRFYNPNGTIDRQVVKGKGGQ